jgi:murein DD-endopeptidase MepM/ murein hydrolase activator NlpD
VDRRKLLRLLASFTALLVILALTAACAADEGAGGVLIEPVEPTASLPLDAIATTPPGPNGAPPTNGASALHGFALPIAGSCLPKGDQLMPNAPRPYRQGIHEGIDFYQVDNCTAITNGTPVLAVYAGRVVRADLGYVDPTREEVAQYLANPNNEQSLDKFRGRQVWIDHGGGVITRYAHLAGVAPGITVGMMVAQGQLIAYGGESGTPESVNNPGHEYHLHFEVRVGDSYLGKGLPPAEVRRLYQTLFSP